MSTRLCIAFGVYIYSQVGLGSVLPPSQLPPCQTRKKLYCFNCSVADRRKLMSSSTIDEGVYSKFVFGNWKSHHSCSLADWMLNLFVVCNNNYICSCKKNSRTFQIVHIIRMPICGCLVKGLIHWANKSYALLHQYMSQHVAKKSETSFPKREMPMQLYSKEDLPEAAGGVFNISCNRQIFLDFANLHNHTGLF